MDINDVLSYSNVVNFPDGMPLCLSTHGCLRINIHTMYCYLNEMEQMFRDIEAVD